MRYRILILILFLYFLVLFQNSFLSHFNILGAFPNLILIFVYLLSFFEGSHKYSGIFSVFIAGFFLDIFSASFLGVSIFSLIIVYLFIKEIMHILRDVSQKYSIIYFIPIFIFSVVLYDFFLGMLPYFLNYSTPLSFGGYVLLLKVVYNLFLAIAGFYVLKMFPTLKHGVQKIQSKSF